ncbi:centrosomal protein of 104 kDa-like isoform X2 [Polyodon spathula]|uniref:centrosomal protein of 104 kDa-like isoform X2 n=1 Tax=Polyodon spathula TaxID=7913 RepID=UPI001B7DFB08|nr:centrosomal protein of 104 kDa-like isoform X2 [Polyodon spathula]
MPHKIGFAVVSSSGNEDGYSAKELMVHAPTVNGWRSTRSCLYPQVIILQLVERCRIRKLQLLAHQYMISAKIEFYVNDSLPEYFSPNQSDRFQRLGYVSLSDNEKTGFKARELKSVHVDAVGQYLKLIFHKNHVNRYNLYNQVALVAVNVLGDAVDGEMESTPTKEQLIEHYLHNTHEDSALDGTYLGKLDSISPLDDLAFDMYQDPEVAQIIRKLDEKKQDAVRMERYDLAKKLKQAIADLQKVGERLGRYEVEKRCAVEKEDYDVAKLKKQQMDEYRRKVYLEIELHSLLDMGPIQRTEEFPLEPLGYSSSPRQPKPKESSKHKQGKRIEKAPKSEPERVSPNPTPPQRTPTPPPTPQPQPPIDALPYDERPLPALRKQMGETQNQLPEPETPESATTARSTGITGEPEPMTEKAVREASFPIEVYGEGLVAGAYSKTWSYREDALLAVYKKLMEVPAGTSKDDLKTMMRAAVFLVRKALVDKVASVFQASLKLLKMIITQYIPKHKLGKVETSHCVEMSLPYLIAKTGDSTTRLRVVATDFIKEMALFKEVMPLQAIPVELVKPLKPSTLARLALSQLELLERLLKDLGTDNSGFTMDNVMRFAVGALEHSASEVRDTAVRIIQIMYRKNKSAVLEYLPADDANTRRNILYKNMFDGFAKIDGRPTETQAKTEKKAATQEAEKQKKEEIRVLQEQLAALKEIQSGQASKGKERDTHKPAKAAGKKAPLVPPPDIGDDQSSIANYLDNLCIFCGERDDSFNEEGLDLHYWKNCPMLRRCEHCRQVVEIASLMDHLLTECDKKDSFGKCPRCTEAIPKQELTEHVRAKACTPAKSDKVANHCPLCHENFAPGEESWKSHLMGKESCKMNQRRMQRTQQVQQGKTGGLSVTKPGVKGRSPSIVTKIPAPKTGLNKTSSRTPAKQ